MVLSDEESTTDEDVIKFKKSRISKKKTHFNLTKYIKLNQKIQNEYVTKFPLVNRSVGFTKIIDSKQSDSESDISEAISLIENENNKRPFVPWHLLDAEPTRIEEIENGLILDKILKNREQMEQKGEEDVKEEKFKRVKNVILAIWNIKTSFKRSKTTSKPDKKIKIIEGLLPEEEFTNLKKKYLEKRFIVEESSNPH